eukprot:137411_1
MLSAKFKTPRAATRFFWTLYFTIAYCFLSTMYLIYPPNNVEINKLIVEHFIRMFIQAVFMTLAMVIQYNEYGGVLGFFDNAIIFFWCVWVFNWILTLIVKMRFGSI